MSVAYTV